MYDVRRGNRFPKPKMFLRANTSNIKTSITLPSKSLES